MKKYLVTVTQEVEVTLDETKFNEQFMQEFRDSFYQFDELCDHVEHLAQLHARGFNTETFIEGYGPPKEMGISMRVEDTHMDSRQIK